MGSLIYLAIIGIQLTSTLVTGSIPLKCFLQNHSFLNLFDKNTELNSLFRFNTVKEDAITLDKDGWLFDTTNLEYDGLDNAVLDDFGFNLNNKLAQVTFHTDIVLTHPYKTSGTLFSLPISGEGSCHINLKNIQFSLTMPFDIEEVNGKKVIELKGYDYSFEVRDKIDFNLSNLYYGNKELSDSMLVLMNQNWKYLELQFGKVFMDKVAETTYNKFKSYLLAMPLKDFNSC